MQQPEDVPQAKKNAGGFHITPLQWFRRGQDSTIISLGEYALPFFMAAVEACWVNGILIGLAGINLLGSAAALLPVWGPFVLLLASSWLFRRALLKESSAPATSDTEEDSASGLPGLGLMVVVLALVTLCLVWAHVYASTSFLFDPTWLGSFLGDLLALNMQFYQALFIIIAAIYLSWRGMHLAQMRVEPEHIFRQIWVGLLIFLLAILFHSNQTNASAHADSVILLLLIPIFLYLALSTHALARLTLIRREHPFGLEGNIADQERATLSVIIVIGLILLGVTILGGIFFNGAVFDAFQPLGHALEAAYDELAWLLSVIVSFITIPFFWLVNWLFSHLSLQTPKANQSNGSGKAPPSLPQFNPSDDSILLAAKIIIPLLILLVLFFAFRLTLRRRKRIRRALNRTGGDIHESVWSWGLLWRQIMTLWASLLQRIFPKHVSTEEQAQYYEEEINAPPAARTMREIYRRLLKKAASNGNMRKHDETAYEFQQRLDEHIPESEPNLGLITEAYTLTRYGGSTPTEGELSAIHSRWKELEQKWN